MSNLDELGVVLQNLLDQYTPPVNLHVLLRGYRIQKGTEVPWESYGYSDPATFLRENFPNQLTVHESPDHKGVNLVTLKNEHPKAGGVSNGSGRAAGDHVGSSAESVSVVSRSMSTIPSRSYSDAFRQTRSTKDYNLTKPVPVPFRTYLARILKNYPTGITAEAYVDLFYLKSGAPLNYTMYGYPGHLSMFRDLTDVFRLETGNNGEHMLYPVNPFGSLGERRKVTEPVATSQGEDNTNDRDLWTPHKCRPTEPQLTSPSSVKGDSPITGNGAEASGASNDQATLAINSLSNIKRVGLCSGQLAGVTSQPSKPAAVATAQLEMTPATNAVTSKRHAARGPQQQHPPVDKCSFAVSKETTSYGDLFIVELNNSLLVPTACLAALAGMSSDHVLEELTDCGLDIQDVKFLSGRVPNHKFLRVTLARTDCPFIINADGSIADVISLVPIEICSSILRALVGVPGTTPLLPVTE